jgi:hypothetical protein
VPHPFSSCQSRLREGRWSAVRPIIVLPVRTLAILFQLLIATALAEAQSNPRKPVRPPLDLPRHDVSIPREWLTGVSDLTAGFGPSEQESYYQVLAEARDRSLSAQKQAAAENLALAEQEFRADKSNRKRQYRLFYDLVTRPESWRGQPVTLRGYIRDLTPMEVGENRSGLEQLYQAHLFTEDSAQFPYVVVCTEIPPGLPRPEVRRPTDFITVTGYFYKLWSYRAETESGRWSAPLILAGRLEWNPPRPTESSWRRLGPVVWLALGGLVTGLVTLLVRRRVHDREAIRRLRGLSQEPLPSESEIRQALEDLSQEEQGPHR